MRAARHGKQSPSSLEGILLTLPLLLGACGQAPQPAPLTKKIVDVPRRFMQQPLAHWGRELQAPQADRRAMALWALADLSERPPAARRWAEAGLQDPSPAVQLSALRLLAALGGAPGPPRRVDRDDGAGARLAGRARCGDATGRSPRRRSAGRGGLARPPSALGCT